MTDSGLSAWMKELRCKVMSDFGSASGGVSLAVLHSASVLSAGNITLTFFKTSIVLLQALMLQAIMDILPGRLCAALPGTLSLDLFPCQSWTSSTAHRLHATSIDSHKAPRHLASSKSIRS